MKRKLRLVLLFSIISTTFLAQQFPVNIVPRINAPAPVNFYNYADETSLNSPITVQIFLNDLTVSSRQIRLKIYFEGGNINFSSRDFVVGAEDLFLEGGIPLTLGINELAPYYRLENIQGTNSAVYGQSIPEGSYNFCFEVYDFISGAKLTTKTCAPVFIFKNEPPILNIPFNGTNIEPKDFENIVFQWTPRHINVSNVEYDFSIVEIWDDSVDPQTAFLSQAPIYETTTRNTSIFYGPDKPLLLPEKRYAWRVQAKALQGIEEIGLFKNQGFSEVFWFSKIAPCQVPEGVTAEAKGTSKINIFWDQDPTLHSEYIIAYREANNPDANWFTKRTNSSWATIWDLKPGTTYEYKIKGKCIYQFSEYSELQNITTDIVQNEDANYNCGIVPDAVAISNRAPHPGLNIGDQVTAGDFKVTITEIQSQSNGVISGKGFVAIPYLKFAKFGVTFSNILVNTDKQLAEGEIVTLYDPEFGEGASMTVDVNINISEGITGDAGGEPEIIKVDFVVDTVEIDSNGAIVVTGTNGETAIIPGGDDVKIVSENGDIWSVDEDGNITEEEGAAGGAVTDASTNGLGADGSVNEITASGVSVVFEKSGYYHFDELPEGTSDTFEKEYKILEAKSGKYRVPYKSISDNKGEDFITATVNITDTTIIKDSIIFKTKDGAKVLIDSWDGNVAKLKLKRKFDYADEEIFAVIKSKDNDKYDIAGSIITTHLASEKLEPINITLVPVFKDENNKDIKAELDKIKEGVEEIYTKAGVVLNIQNVNNISPEEIYEWDKDNDTRVKVGERSVLSTYTEEESVFNKHIKQKTYYNKKTYYVFVTDLQASNSEVDGFMPLNRQFGFIFNANVNSIQKQVRTMAHELGHGIFALEHTWDEYKFAQGATNNLMDYGNGTVLNHLDWKKIHASGIKFYLFQDAQDGQHESYEYYAGFNVIPGEFKKHLPENYTRNDISFISPTGKIITLPNTALDVTFTSKGNLLGFTLLEKGKKERYIGGKRNGAEPNFAGYLKKFSTQSNAKWKDRVYRDELSKKLSRNTAVDAFVGNLNSEPCGINIYLTKIANTSDTKEWNSGGNKGTISTTNYTSGLTPLNQNIINSPAACDLCDKGEKYYNDYSYLAKTDASKASLINICKLLCEDADKYGHILAQIGKDFSDQLDNLFWLSEKADYRKARDLFWEQENAFTLYYEALKDVKENIDKYNKDLNINASKEKYYSALYYLNDKFIESLTYDKKQELVSAIFKHNYFITESIFNSKKSDASLFKKIILSFNDSEYEKLINYVAEHKNDEIFTESKRNVLFEITYATNLDKLKKLTIDSKLEMLEVLLNGRLKNMFSNNQDALVVKIVESIRNDQATEFFNQLESKEKYSIKDSSGNAAPLLFHLKEKLTDFLNPDNSYTQFFKEIRRLSDVKNNIGEGDEFIPDVNITWNVEQKDYVLISFVSNKNKFEYKYDEKNHTVGIKKCVKHSLYQNPKTGNYSQRCDQYEELLKAGSSPFELVGITMLNDISPFTGNCKDGKGENEICGQILVVPAIFLDYLNEKINTQRWKNFGWNTFNVIITVTTFGEGAAAISAIRAAKTGTRLAVAAKHWYTLIDFTYTVTDLSLKIANVNMPKEWGYVGYLFAAKTSYDLLSNGGLKGLAFLKKASKKKRREIVEELGVKKNGKDLDDNDLKEFVENSEESVKNSSEEIQRKYKKALEELENISSVKRSILGKIDDFKVANSKFKEWVKSLKDNPELIKNLDALKKSDLEELAKDFDFSVLEITKKFVSNPDVVKSWEVLKGFPKIRIKEGNIEILAKIHKRFQYNNKESFEGLNKLFNEGSKVASKQKLLDGLKEANKVFDGKLPVKFSAIKKGSVTVNHDAKIIDRYGKGEEVGRYVDGVLQKKKVIPDGDGTKVVKKGDNPDDDILQKGDEVGFRYNVDFSSYNIPGAIRHVKYRDLSNIARRDIAGCHDITEFNKIRQIDAIGNPNYSVSVGKKLDDVEEIIIMSKQNHSVPGVTKIEYRVPASDGKLVVQVNGKNVNKGYTTGATKGRKATENYEKTVYDPKVWSDIKLEKAVKEAVQDAMNKNGGILPSKFNGKTAEGYEIEGYFRNGIIDTFYFK